MKNDGIIHYLWCVMNFLKKIKTNRVSLDLVKNVFICFQNKTSFQIGKCV